MTLFIHLLGQTRLLVDAQLLRLTAPPKTLPLLGYLLLHCRRPLDRQRVAFALWPDESEGAARANLRRHLHHLQHALPPAPAERPWLLNEDGVIGWNSLSDFWLDVDEFERLGQQPVKLEEAVACYTGALLPDVYDDWIFADRERLHNRYLDALLRLSIRHRTQHNYAKALNFAQKLLADEPFREDVVRQLMQQFQIWQFHRDEIPFERQFT